MADVIKVVLTLDDSQLSVASQRVGTTLKQVQTALVDTAKSTRAIDEHFNGLSGKMRDLVATAGLLRFALYDIRDVFGATIGKVVESSAQIEKMTVLMKGLSNATTEQSKALDAIKSRDFVFNLAKNAPFEVNALTDAFVKLKAAGMDPTNGSLQTLVNSVSKFGGSSETLQRASVAIQQMAGKGVISMEELRQQLGEAVPTAMRNMAEGMGLSMAELVKHVSKGEVDSTTALRRMFTVMQFENEGAAEELNKTWVGQMAKLKTNFTLFANQIGQGGFFEVIEKSLSSINKYFESTSGKNFAIQVGLSLKSFIDGVTSSIAFVSKYGTEIKDLAKTLAILWGGNTVYKALEGINSLLQTNISRITSAYNAEKQAQQNKINLQRELLVAEGEANIKRIAAQAETSRVQIALLAAQYREQIALKDGYEAQYEAADAIGRTRRLANGKFTSAAIQAENAAIALSLKELSVASEASAAKFAAAEARMAVAATDAMVVTRASTIATGESLALVGTRAGAASIASGLFGRAVSALGGPLGILAIALTFGGTLWELWGNKSKEAADKATAAIAKTKAGLADLNTAQAIKGGVDKDRGDLANLQQQVKDIESVKSQQKNSTVDLQLPALKKQISDKLAMIAEGEKQVDVALKQGATNTATDYATGIMKNIQVGLADQLTAIKSKSAEKLTLLRASNLDTKEKTKQINDETVKASTEMTKLEISANDRNVKQLTDNIRKNTDAKGHVINEQLAKNQEQLKILLSDNATALNSKLANQNEVGTEFKFSPKADKNSGAGSAPENKMQKLIDSLRDKNIALSTEGKKATDTLAKLYYDLDNTDKYVTKGKKGALINPTYAQKNEALGLARKNAVLEGLDEDEKHLEKVTKEIEKSYDALEKGVIDGEAQYQAALNNFNSGGKTDTNEYEKFKAEIDLKKKVIVDYYASIGASAESAQSAVEMMEKTLALKGDTKALNLAATYQSQTEAVNLSLIENASERAKAESVIKLKSLDDDYNATIARTKQGSEAQLNLTKEYLERRDVMMKEYARKAETPMQSLARSWRDTTTQMQNASTKWANSTIDAFLELAKTGKTSFSGLVDSILTDILRIALQKQLSSALESVFGAIEKGVGGIFKSSSSDGAENPGIVSKEDLAKIALNKTTEALTATTKAATDQAGQLGDGLGQTAVESVLQAGKTASVSSTMSYLAQAANNAANSLSQLASSGGASGDSGGGLFGSIGDLFGSIFGGGGSGAALPDFVPSFSGMTFANGGIMTSMGAVELRKYANGGIANKPQAAIFGEGSMNEAYVPLPDGKTIPVTMSGSGGNAQAANVTVNVINAPAGTTTEQKSNPDGSTSIDVIIAQVEGKISQNVAKGRGSLSQVMEKTYALNRATGSYR